MLHLAHAAEVAHARYLGNLPVPVEPVVRVHVVVGGHVGGDLHRLHVVPVVIPGLVSDRVVPGVRAQAPRRHELSPGLGRGRRRPLKLLFDDLVKDGVVARNPCTEMDTPRRDTQPRRALKPEAIREFIAQLDFTREADIAYFLAVSTGMRRGEVCGLSWRDVDLESQVISIRKSYDCFGNLKDPKTKAGVRRLPMPDSVRDALVMHKEAQKARIDEYAAEQERLAKKNGEKPGKRLEQSENTPVVLSTTMGRLSPNVLEAWWLRDRETLDLDGWAFHELRHSYLSTLALRGVHPKVMQEPAGHASSEITMEIYTHVNMEAKRAAADVVSDLFSEPVEAAPAVTPIVQVEPRVINGGRRLTLVSSPRERVENASESASEQPQERFVLDSYQAATR